MIQLKDLKCNNLKAPLGIDTKIPSFSWKLYSDENNRWQQAYRIYVRDENGDFIWDSGKIVSNRSIGILYQGKPLESKRIYTWKAEVWDDRGRKIVGPEETFETAYLDSSAWRGEWIGRQIPADKVPGPDPDADLGQILVNMMTGGDVQFEPDRKLEQCNAFTKTFTVDKNVERARIYMSAHGIYDLKVNGENPDDSLFNPGFTKYEDYLEYQVYDVASFLKCGANEITVTLADGWYKGKFGILGIGENYGDELSFILNMDILYEDGTEEHIDSDESFVYEKTPWIYSDIFIGCKYDARLEKACSRYEADNINEANNIDNTDNKAITIDEDSRESTKHARICGGSFSNLKAKSDEPVRPLMILKPRLLISPKGEKILDFGQNMVGVVRFNVSGKRGTEVILEHTEVLDKEGNYINCVDGFNRDQTDIYILSGNDRETFMPMFTFHGFRYVKVSGYPGELCEDDFDGIVIGSDCALTGSFYTSNEKLNQLQSNIQWGQRGNLLSIPTDCPQRERAGWTGDVWVYGETCNYNQDCYNFFRKWLKNMRLEQYEDGLIPIVVPYIRAYEAIQLQSFGTHTSAGWGDVIVSLPWVLYNVYGDISILWENYEAMEKWMSYVKHETETGVHLKENADEAAKERQKYLWNTNFHFGDWLYPSCKNEKGEPDMFQSANTTKEHIATAIYANSTDIMSKVCHVLGLEEKAEDYKELNKNIRNAFEAEYVSDDGIIDNDIQGLYVMALAMNMVSGEKRTKLAKRLDTLIKENDGCLDTGFMSIKFLMDVLVDNGLTETAKTILYQEKCPSWLYEVNQDATTVWETWNSIQPDGERLRFSYNHYAFGCIGSFMYRRILGISLLEPGYKSVLIAPDFNFNLSCAGGRYDSVYGPISVEWVKKEDRIRLEVEIPANVDGYLKISGQPQKKIGNGKFIYTFPIEK